MTLPTKPIDTTQLEFRYQGASEYRAYNSDTDRRDEHQARDENTGYPIFTIRCQVLFRAQRESGLITVRVPLPAPPAEDLEFEQPIRFESATSKSWNMEGRDGQTWTAKTMTIVGGPSASPAPNGNGRKATKVTAADAA